MIFPENAHLTGLATKGEAIEEEKKLDTCIYEVIAGRLKGV